MDFDFDAMRAKAKDAMDKAKVAGGIAKEKLDKKIEETDLQDVWDKAVDKAKEPSNKQLLTEGAIGVALVVLTGGAVVPAIAVAALEGVVMKKAVQKYSNKDSAKKESEKKSPAKKATKPTAHKPRKAGPKPE